MDTNANQKYRPFSAGREFMNLEREKSNVFEIAIKPVSSPNRTKTLFIAGTAIVCVSVVVAIAVAVTISTKDQSDSKHSSLKEKVRITPTPVTTTTTTAATPTTSTTTTGTTTTTAATPTTSTTTTGGTPVATTLQTTTPTTTTPAVPSTNGTWNNWGAWTSCGATCGTGSKTRYRTCLRASPSDPICTGEYVQTTTCSLTTCPVYGVWTTWSGWSSCDVTCGGGTQQRTRVCQKASLSDLDCVGRSSQSQTCNTWNCPDCSQTCTTGSLNAECTACECTSNTVQGIVRNHVNVPLDEASIAHANVPYKTLATTNETGGFTLDTTCDAVEIVITRTGYADVTVVVTGTTVSVQMSLIRMIILLLSFI
ncbi:semaphorin-5B-like [Argopecten irradians]|uniref:semaphorin-5B-like n=1 Tax=Argopecten irradians TaxID=31199 RepID=UPI0037172AB6